MIQRKPAKRLKSRPVTFSRFARFVALASVCKVKHNPRSSECSKSIPPIFHGQEVDLAMKNKNEQPESSDDEEFKGVVQADFVFFDPKPDDFHGVKLLLQNYLDDKQWDLSGFTDLILGQPSVGSVVKIEDDKDNGVYAVASVLNLGRYKPTEELRKSFCFTHYLFVGKIYQHKKRSSKQARTSSSTEDAIIYTKPEDEIFHKLCSWSFSFPLCTQQHSAHELKNYKLLGLVMAVEASKVGTFREQLHSLIDE